MQSEDSFLQAIRANPSDEVLRLVYADWLEERGDSRGEFLRLQHALKSLSPDHLHRVSGEYELSFLRKNLDPGWLADLEPNRALLGEDSHSCTCLMGLYEDQPRLCELELHRETQDTECDAWKRLLDLVEDAAADGRSDFIPWKAMKSWEEWKQILTLPTTIAKLKSVRRLHLYGSHLVRIPPEIGEMSSLEYFDPYTSYWLHWFPYEITRCKNLKDSRVSTRALYGNFKSRPPFPRLQPEMTTVGNHVAPAKLSLRHWKTDSIRNCSVCNQPFEDRRQHRVWISLRVATDVLPLLVNACSRECITKLPSPAGDHVQHPHRGGLEVQQPSRYWERIESMRQDGE